METTRNPAGTIAGVPPLGWGKHRETTFLGALEAALAVTETPCDYETLMGATGLAFRTRWFQGPDARWCPSSPVGEFPEEMEAASRATGWRLRCECLLGEKEPRMEAFAPDIAASIDAGRPVLAYERKLNLGVIIGYEDGGQTVVMYDYFGGERPARLPIGEVGPMLVFLAERREPLSRRDAVLQGLRMAVRNGFRRHDPDDETRGYWMGRAALEKWAEDIGLYDTLTDEEREKLFSVSWWNFDALEDARRAAVAFLRGSLDLFEGESRAAIGRAADLYDQEWRLCASAFEKQDAFLGPWTGRTARDWTPEARRREQEILTRARNIECAALDEIDALIAKES